MDENIIYKQLKHKYIYNSHLILRNMINIQGKKDKILLLLKENGPSLPVQVARAIEMDPVFASAIASELLGSKQIKTSHMKVGASMLYLLPGQEQKLEEHTDNLKSIEKEAYLKIKTNKLIKDEDEEPATRVALRNIKDFAIPFKFQDKIMWKYAFVPNEEIEKLLSPIKTEEKISSIPTGAPSGGEQKTTEKPVIEEEVPKAWRVKREEIKKAKDELNHQVTYRAKKIENIFHSHKEKLSSQILKPEDEKIEIKFLTEIKNFLKQKNIKFVEEIRTEKKEIVATVNITSQLGDTNFLLIAKNKKTTTKSEIEAAIQMAIKNKMSCLLIMRKEQSKSIQKIIDENHLIKLEIMG